MSPRVVIAAPLFNKADYVTGAVRSLLAQTYEDFALLLIDDRSDDDTVERCRAIAAEDARVEVHVNERRLGMLGNTNRALSLARERHPAAEFWALGSDHDIWEPRWLETVVGLLDAHPQAVLAYTQTVRVDEHNVPYDRGERGPWLSDTRGITAPRERMRAAFRGMVAGDMVYGLFRVQALDEIGRLYRPVLVPDRLMLTEVALRGEFVQAPEVLWRRRFRGLADLERQRRAFFLDDVPAYAHAPWWAQHTGALVPAYGARLAAEYLQMALTHRYRRRLIRYRRWRSRYRLKRIASRTFDRTLARYGPGLGARLRDTLVWMDGHRITRPVAVRARPHFDRTVGTLNARGQGKD